jgi:N-carbamoyl-L-amino-acid hydrolase
VDRSEIRRQQDAVRRVLESVEADRGVSTSLECPYDMPPTPLSDRCRAAVEAAARRAGVETMAVHSGAGHDTMRVAEVTDAALLFVASEDGHSHSPKERADWADCADAATVLAESLARLATTGTADGDEPGTDGDTPTDGDGTATDPPGP